MSSKNKIYIYYWKENENFGDLLAPYLMSKLSIIPIEYFHPLSLKARLSKIKNGILKMQLKLSDVKDCFVIKRIVLFTVGSILQSGNKNSTFWGSGFMNDNNTFKGGKVYAVRGHYSADKLQDLGYPKCDIVGDPALLLPIIYDSLVKKQYNISIIPHWKEVDYFKNKYGDKYNIIDLRTSDIERVIDEIRSSKYILSTSLHGLIVSHTYDVPALWIKYGYIDTDGFKFKDYFSSVNIEEYDGYTNIDELLNLKLDQLGQLFDQEKQRCLPNRDCVSNIQKNLLSVAPFDLNPIFKKL